MAAVYRALLIATALALSSCGRRSAETFENPPPRFIHVRPHPVVYRADGTHTAAWDIAAPAASGLKFEAGCLTCNGGDSTWILISGVTTVTCEWRETREKNETIAIRTTGGGMTVDQGERFGEPHKGHSGPWSSRGAGLSLRSSMTLGGYAKCSPREPIDLYTRWADVEGFACTSSDGTLTIRDASGHPVRLEDYPGCIVRLRLRPE